MGCFLYAPLAVMVVPAAPASTPSLLKGIALVCASVMLFGLLDVSVGFITATIPILAALWVRYALQLVTMLLLVRRRSGRWWPRSQNVPWQVARGVSFMLSNAFSYISLRYVSVAEFTAIVLMAPVLVSVLAMLILRERLEPIRWLLLAGTFTGAMLIIHPGDMEFEWVLLWPLLQVLVNVFYLLVTAHVARYDGPLTSQAHSGAVGLLVVSLILPWAWQSVDADWVHWAALAGGALAGTLGHLLLTGAYKYAPSTVLMPYLYVQIAVAALLGWLFFGTIPGLLSSLGIGLIALCGVGGAVLSWRSPSK